MTKKQISFMLNGKKQTVTAEPMTPLLDILREELNMKGTKKGCGEGECGACTVIIDNKLSLACITPIVSIEGSEVLTIEGLQKEGEMTYIQRAFVDKGAVQCGFCTPGFVISAHHYIENDGELNDEKIKHALSGNFCRCTGYQKIVEGVKEAIVRKNGGEE